MDGVAGQGLLPLQQGERPLASQPVAPRSLTPVAPQLLGTGSHAVSSVLAMAKKYPRVLVLHEDKLLCCKLDEMDLCTYKWLKKARRPPQCAAPAPR